jgi:diguanylate cyclase (GGDEF)-like protein
VFLDVNGFKQVNDGLGHEAGDELLVAFARRLELSFDKPAIVGRFAGDEFVMFVVHEENSYHDADIDRAVTQMTREPFYLAGAVLPVRASFGIARLGRDGDSLTDLLAAADQSMYAMKRRQASAAADANRDQPLESGTLRAQVLT